MKFYEKKTINIIGAGSLGKTIAKLIAMNRVGLIEGVCNASFESTAEAVRFIQAGMPFEDLKELPSVDITFITVPDDKIADVCEAYSRSPHFNPSGIIIHCSGLLTSDALISAKKKGCHVMSAHPMRSFADPSLSVQKFAGTYCAIEGEITQDAKATVFKIFNALGAKIIHVNKDKKSTYHAAGVIASNYFVTIASTAIECLKNSGINDEDATNIVFSLMEGALGNLVKTRSPEKALTGPIKRGDIGTIKKHLDSLDDEQIKEAYTALGKLTLNLTSHSPDRKKMIEDALQSTKESLRAN
jgi:predicted short-subunit dehydrogenase-like oxidoreductase (DUF2520 family)